MDQHRTPGDERQRSMTQQIGQISPPPDSTVFRAAPKTILVGLLVGAALANLAEFPVIEYRTPPHWRALSAYESGDLSDIALRLGHPDNVRQRFGLALSLAEIAPGSELIVADSLRMSRTRARGLLMSLGRVSQIDEPDYDPESFLADFDPEPYIIAAGDGGDRGEPYAIAVARGTPERFVWLRRETSDGVVVDVLVDERLLPPGALDGLGS